MLDDKGAKAELEVDGGINASIAPKVVQAGAEVLVAGNAIFNSTHGATKALQEMRRVLGLAG